MKTIGTTLRTFVKAVRNRVPITCTPEGMWCYEGLAKRWWRLLTGDKNGDIISLAKGFVHALDQLEHRPVEFQSKQNKSNLLYLKATKAIIVELENLHPDKTQLITELKRRFIGLLYRLEDANGGFSRRSPDSGDQMILRQLALQWKEQNPLVRDKFLTDDDIERLTEAGSYPIFMELLLDDTQLQNAFFGWTLRDKNLASPFIQFPAMAEKITASAMAGRIGRINPHMLKIQRDPTEKGYRKILTLPFEGRSLNILNSNRQYTFRGDYTLTVDEVFTIFAEKYAQAGSLEFLAGGICNWNFLRCGWWNAKEKRYSCINIKRKDWWRELPPLETLSTSEARKRYGDHIDGVHWNVAAAASRGSATLDYEATHAYLNIAIPNGDGSYNVYDFGKLANEFPTTMIEKLRMFAFNVHASVAFPDESIFYSQREHTYYSVPMSPEQAFGVMESIRKDMIVSREQHFVYQIESDNCARWAQEKIEAAIGEDVLPNLFQMHLLATEPTGPSRVLFDLIKKMPKDFRTFVLTRLHIPLGAKMGTWIMEQGRRVKKSLASHEFFETGLVYLPAYLHKQQEIGLLGYVIDGFERFLSVVQDASAFSSFRSVLACAIKVPCVYLRKIIGRVLSYHSEIHDLIDSLQRTISQRAAAVRLVLGKIFSHWVKEGHEHHSLFTARFPSGSPAGKAYLMQPQR